jgi:hypothetical protein
MWHSRKIGQNNSAAGTAGYSTLEDDEGIDDSRSKLISINFIFY